MSFGLSLSTDGHPKLIDFLFSVFLLIYALKIGKIFGRSHINSVLNILLVIFAQFYNS